MKTEFTGYGNAEILNLPGKMTKPIGHDRSETASPSQYWILE